ncbi:hypothetical protein VTI74DRAFT_4533 [Chaetomium olivicolor]
MKFSALPLAAALLAAGALSQGKDCTSVALTAIPSCAQHCFLENAPTIGCGGLDFACQCKQQAALYAAIEGCVASSCPSSEFQNVIDGAAAVCDCAGPGSGGNQGSQVPGSYVSSPPTAPPASATPPPTATTTGGSSGGGSSPTRSVPSNHATSSVISGADLHSRSGLGFVSGAFAAALAFALI